MKVSDLEKSAPIWVFELVAFSDALSRPGVVRIQKRLWIDAFFLMRPLGFSRNKVVVQNHRTRIDSLDRSAFGGWGNFALGARPGTRKPRLALAGRGLIGRLVGRALFAELDGIEGTADGFAEFLARIEALDQLEQGVFQHGWADIGSGL